MFQMYTKVIPLHTRIKVSQTETTIYDITYTWNLKKRCKWNLFSRSRLADAGNRLTVTRGERRREGCIGDWGLTDTRLYCMRDKWQARPGQHVQLGPRFKSTVVVKLWDGPKTSRTGGASGEQSGGSYNNPRKILNLGSWGRRGHWHSPNQPWGESSCLGRKRQALESFGPG